MSRREDDPGPFFRLLIDALDRAQVPHMLVGSYASGVHGTPRYTNDIDLVIDPDLQSLHRLLANLSEAEVYFDAEVAEAEFRRRAQFNVIDIDTSWKTDLIYRPPTAFGRSQFERRTPATVLGASVYLATAEDTLLAKLQWAKIGGGSEQQLRDVRGIIDVQGDRLDRAYIEGWLDELGVRDLWERVQQT